ncbi:MAG TPA: ArsR family transcriptional regulator [Ktedonobacterales bacterium]
MPVPWNERFLGSTRGRVIASLRRDTQTVEDLATALQLTDNAVRAHLATLERDGIVRHIGVRRSGKSGKPAFTYGLTPEAEYLFPRPYAEVLDEVLGELQAHLAPHVAEALLRASGSHLASRYPAPNGPLTARLENAVTALNQLGGLAELERHDDQLVIQGYSCPLAALVPNHPEVCRLAETFVSDVAGLPLRESCERGPTPRCRFVPLTHE